MGCILANCNIDCICHRPELPWAVAMEEAAIRGLETEPVIIVNPEDFRVWQNMYCQVIGNVPTHFQGYIVVVSPSIPQGKCAIAVRFR